MRKLAVNDGPGRPERPAHAQDNATVQKLADQFAEAFNKNAASGVGEMYTEDAILVPPQADIRMGRRDIQAFWTQQAKRAEDLSITVLDVKPLGPGSTRRRQGRKYDQRPAASVSDGQECCSPAEGRP